MNLSLRLLLPVALLVTGCADNDAVNETADASSGSGGETEAPPTGAVEIEDFFTRAEQAFCAWQVECRGYGTESRCRSVNHLEDRLSFARLTGVGSSESLPTAYLIEAVKVGRIGYDREKAGLCLDYVRGRGCDRPDAQVVSAEALAGQQACREVLSGRMGRNGPCLAALECAEQAVCGYDPTCVDMCCVGACRVLPAPLALGEPCGVNNRGCEADTYCAFDLDTFMPTVCTRLPTVGQSCANSGACAGESRCDNNLEDPICVALGGPGASCFGDHNCAHPGVCQRDMFYNNGKCRAPADEGEPCDPDSPDDICRRVDNTCDLVSRTCVALPDVGQPCPQYRCRGDLFCTNAGLCSPVADAAEPCGYLNGDFVPCSGDHICDYSLDQPSCRAPSGVSACPVPTDG